MNGLSIRRRTPVFLILAALLAGPAGARAACHLPEARALENHVYYLAVNRAGEERGFRFVGRSRLIDYRGEVVAGAGEAEATFSATIEPEKARDKRVVVIPGKHEVDRVGDRRPGMYGPLL